MKKNTAIIILIFGIISLSSSFALATAPAPPDGVSEIIEQMGEFEESFENQNWSEADEAIEKIDNELKEVFAQSKLNDTTLTQLLGNLKKSIKIKEEKLTETNFILFQNQYFNFINNFYFKIHPLLAIIKQYMVDEAAEALSKKDYDEVVSEMREAANLMKQAKTLLTEKGIAVSEISWLQAQIIETIKAGRAKDADRINELLQDIKIKYMSMLEQYKSAST